VALGLAIRFGLPIPDGVTPQGWTLTSIFVSTVLGLVFEPLPTGGR
jgi:DASS family divalent anion:Na+ symporter